MIIERYEEPNWLSNTWLVAARPGGDALLVDAGLDAETILAAAAGHDLRIRMILLTHHHHDHAGHAAEIARRTGAEVVAHEAEVPLFGRQAPVTRVVGDGIRLTCGSLSIKTLHIPGHTAGQLAFHLEGVGLFTGDTLFRRSIGGTMAPGHTTFSDLRHSLVERLLAFPDDEQVLPGHRLPSTVGEERAENPFLRVMLGIDPEGTETADLGGQEVGLVVWARDYDGGHKAWIRRADGSQDVVPGSRIKRLT
ncbi:MAG: MBL fold metallo-hydrolase [Acidobacteria bacterium]|nr:MAG: MBL fold metallo-hydrolase [Acidobacteriota bacterium]